MGARNVDCRRPHASHPRLIAAVVSRFCLQSPRHFFCTHRVAVSSGDNEARSRSRDALVRQCSFPRARVCSSMIGWSEWTREYSPIRDVAARADSRVLSANTRASTRPLGLMDGGRAHRQTPKSGHRWRVIADRRRRSSSLDNTNLVIVHLRTRYDTSTFCLWQLESLTQNLAGFPLLYTVGQLVVCRCSCTRRLIDRARPTPSLHFWSNSSNRERANRHARGDSVCM